MNPFEKEPAVLAAGIMGVVYIGAAFGLPIDEGQKQILKDNIPVVLPMLGGLAVWIRQLVTPTAKAEEQAAEAFGKGWDTRGQAEAYAAESARTGVPVV